MWLRLKKDAILRLDLNSVMPLPAGTALMALKPSPQNGPMDSWDDYNFSSDLQVTVPDLNMIGFLAPATVIYNWHSPFVADTAAARWCEWQLQMISSGTFKNDFQNNVLSVLTNRAHYIRELLSCFKRFNEVTTSLSKMTDVSQFRKLEGGYMVLFRFYTGERHGLLPKVLASKYEGQRIDRFTLLPKPKDAPVLHRRPLLSGLFLQDTQPRGKRVKTGDASAHGQGYTELSPYVSTGPSLPNLIASTSQKLKVILFGKQIFPEAVREQIQADQATHLGVFFVPAGRWRCEFTGLESQMERETLYVGFTESDYEGLWDYQMFTLRNPFKPSSGYGARYPVDAINDFFT